MLDIKKGWHYDNTNKMWTNGKKSLNAKQMFQQKIVKRSNSGTDGRLYFHVYDTKLKQIRIILAGWEDRHVRTIIRLK